MLRFSKRGGHAAVASLFGLLVGLWPSTGESQVSAAKLTFGIVPQQSASQLAEVWVPLMRHLSEQTGHDIRFATAKDIPTFEACLAAGAYDVAYMNPYHYTTFSKTNGYRAFARQANKKLKGILVVRKDSDIDSLEDLDGQTLAFPSPAAFGASVIPRAIMQGKGISIEPKYVRSHDSVYRSVASGLFPAGGGVTRTLGNIPQDLRDQVRVLYETDAFTPHAFATHPNVDDAIVASLSSAMLAVQNNEPTVLEPLGMAGIEPGKDADWDDIRALNLTRAQTEIVTDTKLSCHSN